MFLITYRNILVTNDLSEEVKHVLETVVGLRQNHNAELLVVRIVEPASIAYGSVYMIELGKSIDTFVHRRPKKQALWMGAN